MAPPQITDAKAKLIFFSTFVDGKLDAPKSLLPDVHRLYFDAQYEEFWPDVEFVESVHQRLQEAGSDRNSRRPQSWGRLSRPVAGIVKVGPIQWWPHTERVRLVPVRRVCNPIRVAEESACAPLRLLIMVVDRAGMQFLHYGQDSSPRARGDEQPTG